MADKEEVEAPEEAAPDEEEEEAPGGGVFLQRRYSMRPSNSGNKRLGLGDYNVSESQVSDTMSRNVLLDVSDTTPQTLKG